MKRIPLKPIAALLAVLPLFSWSHSEHDKPRYVAVDGKDIGRCDVVTAPCKTILYAAKKSNKGDRILLAEGSYTVTNPDELFYLISNLVPIYGGYSRTDEYQTQDIANNPTTVSGVPLEFALTLQENGIKSIVDGKRGLYQQQVKQKLAQYKNLSKRQSSVACDNGQAGDFQCNSLGLLSHVPLNEMDLSPSAGSDIWGHYDLNAGREYALMGLRNGITVVDVTDPESPFEVGGIGGDATTWRDLKTYQYFDDDAGKWKAYAYVTADSASNGLVVVDLNDLPISVSVANVNPLDLSAHNVYLSNVDYSTGVALPGMEAFLHIAGGSRFGGAFNSYSLANAALPQGSFAQTSASRSDYTHDGSSLVIEDNRAFTQCKNPTDKYCEIFLDFNEQEFHLWDKTDNASPEKLSSTTYNNARYVHSGWWSEDKKFIFVHDELDEMNGGLEQTMLRVYNIEDLTNPIPAGAWQGPTGAIDHNGFTRGNRYYMSNYTRGLTVLDITNPSSPEEVGFFDTFPMNNQTSFNGAWGVYPYLPSGNLLVSDINSGLYVLSDNTLSSDKGSLSFSAKRYRVAEGETIGVEVLRNGGSSGSITVGYELLTGSADNSDFVLDSGELTWADGDLESKTISVETLTDESNEFTEKLFVRLFDPRNGATLSAPNLTEVDIVGTPIKGEIKLVATDNVTALESQGSYPIKLVRVGGYEGELSSQLEVVDDSTGEAIQTIVSVWQDQDSSLQNASFMIENDDLPTGDKAFTVNLLSGSNGTLTSSFKITVKDDDNNTAPTVDAGNDVSANTQTWVTLNGTASDADGDDLTIQWTQTSGEAVSISNGDTMTPTFITPSTEGSITLEVTVTDMFGATATDSVTVSAKAPATTTPVTPNVGGGGSMGAIATLLLLFVARIRNRGQRLIK